MPEIVARNRSPAPGLDLLIVTPRCPILLDVVAVEEGLNALRAETIRVIEESGLPDRVVDLGSGSAAP